MQNWEYAFIEYVREQKGFDLRNGVFYWGDDRGITLSIKDRLNNFGREGWEVASTCGTNNYICWTLRRQLNSSETPKLIKKPSKKMEIKKSIRKPVK